MTATEVVDALNVLDELSLVTVVVLFAVSTDELQRAHGERFQIRLGHFGGGPDGLVNAGP